MKAAKIFYWLFYSAMLLLQLMQFYLVQKQMMSQNYKRALLNVLIYLQVHPQVHPHQPLWIAVIKFACTLWKF